MVLVPYMYATEEEFILENQDLNARNANLNQVFVLFSNVPQTMKNEMKLLHGQDGCFPVKIFPWKSDWKGRASIDQGCTN
ncbi:hypothetical protein SUGI_0251890 [Cryptomeria japonica]|nr:hypothetical protein SUGI_0251890 [Cryptomeria japonica]